ncbi:MAG: hypothetical protein KIT74_05545 [Fimbriimonadales bacterium]|nr:hypothetical protein [Fimbriimonadales bacterium]
MPIYAYECNVCARVFEVEQRIVEDPLKDCPHCDGASSLKRLVQPIAVLFKGSGFHINDYGPKAAEQKSAEGCAGTPASCPACGPTTEGS